MACNHEDWPCCGCGCGSDFERFDDGDICQGCGEPEAYCVCDEFEDDCDGDDGMDGDHETASLLRALAWTKITATTATWIVMGDGGSRAPSD